MKNKLVLLAAGNSTRFHQNKLLYLLQGKAMLQYILDTLQQVELTEVIVVTQYEEVKQLAQSYQYTVVWNAHPQLGISHSLQLGLAKAMDSDHVMFLVGDQPHIKAATIQKLFEEADTTHILCASVAGEYGNPVVFPALYFPELMALQGDVGGKVILKKHPEIVKGIEVDALQCVDYDEQERLFDL